MHGNAEEMLVRPDGTPTRLLIDLDCHQVLETAQLARRCQILATAATKHGVAAYSRSRRLSLNVARTVTLGESFV